MPRALPTSLYILLFFVLIVGNISIYREIFAPNVLNVTILDVGKGDAALVRTPNGMTVLIDAGSDASTLRALGDALPPWQRKIDVVALTSAAAGSAGGLPAVMNRYYVSTLVRAGAQGSKSLEDALAAGASAEIGLRQSAVPYGTRLSLDTVHVDIISPGTLTISYGATLFPISSTTPKGVYISDGDSIHH